MKTNNELENTTNELYAFFGIQPEEDMRDFSIVDFNQAYLKKLNTATTVESKAEVKENYTRLYNHVIEKLRNYERPEETFNMVSFLDEHVNGLKNASSNNYRSV